MAKSGGRVNSKWFTAFPGFCTMERFQRACSSAIIVTVRRAFDLATYFWAQRKITHKMQSLRVDAMAVSKRHIANEGIHLMKLILTTIREIGCVEHVRN